MKILGITGGSGSGKTTLLQAAEARGGCGIDCDAVYHRLLREDGQLLAQIGARFPGTVENGALNRKKLGTLVFADARALADLNQITHGRVVREVRRLLEQARRQGKSLAAIDAIGLFESGLDALCEKTVAVIAPMRLRVQRLVAREGIGEAYALERIRAQKSDGYFAALCDETLVNDCRSREEFRLRCGRWLENWCGKEENK